LGQNSPTAQQVPESAMAQRARAAASQLTGISAGDLSIVKESPLADTGITRFKLTDARGKIYGVSLDSAGNPVSQEVLRQAVQTIANKGFVGKLESELANRLSQESNSPINVVFFTQRNTSCALAW
jgi:hypothetical protein